jgi:hypothetical protein
VYELVYEFSQDQEQSSKCGGVWHLLEYITTPRNMHGISAKISSFGEQRHQRGPLFDKFQYRATEYQPDTYKSVARYLTSRRPTSPPTTTTTIRELLVHPNHLLTMFCKDDQAMPEFCDWNDAEEAEYIRE